MLRLALSLVFFFFFLLSKSAIAIGLWFSGLQLQFRVLAFLGLLAKLGVFSFEVVVDYDDNDHLYYLTGFKLQVVDSKLASKLWTLRLLKIKTLSIWS